MHSSCQSSHHTCVFTFSPSYPHTHIIHLSIDAPHPILLRNSDNPTSGPPPRIPRRLALLMPALTQIIRARVHNNRAAEDALRPNQLHQLVGDGALGVALGVGLDVAEVADVALAVGGGAVGLGEGVDWTLLRQGQLWGSVWGERDGEENAQ